MKSFDKRSQVPQLAARRSQPTVGRAVQARLLTVAVFCLIASTIHAQDPGPWFGTWQQVPPQKKWFDPWPYQKVTLRIEPWEDGLTVVYDMVRRRGGVTHMEWTGRFDGADYPVQGVDYVLTNAYRRLSPNSYQIVVKVDGRAAAVATTAVSPDGSHLTVDTVEGESTTTAVYVRRQ